MSTKPIMQRRDLLRGSVGLGSLALIDLLLRDNAGAGQAPPAMPHFRPRARRVIFLFMHGGPSHVDTFDYKPQLIQQDNQPLPFDKPRIQFAKTGNLLRSPWQFRQYGQSGGWVSDLFPNVGRCVDDLTFIHSMHGSNEAHGGALLKVHTGSDTFVRPSMGSWISYGLGTENKNLPSFITINPTLGHGGVRNFGSAFLPPIHQATRIGSTRAPMKDAKIENLASAGKTSLDLQRLQLKLLRDLDQVGTRRSEIDAQLAARLDSFELAFRMQSETPELMDLSRETAETMALYGIDDGPTDNFGRQCLLARRLSEAGVRFVQVTHNYWDQHNQLKEKHAELAAEVDRPIAGLITDLKRRGMLRDTLLIWGAEFGRTPTAQGNRNGRDHNPHAFTYWMAGGGVKQGFHYGRSDDFGFYAAEDKVHVHDFHATVLHLLGIDHERLTYHYGGRDFRLTDVEGTVIDDLFA